MTTNTDKYYQVTIWGRPDDPVNIIVQHQQRTATVTYERWLNSEVARWAESNGRDAFLMENSEGLVALFSHKDYEKPVSPEEAT